MSYFIQHRPLCLASSSPRRKALLKKFNLEFDCYSPNVIEKPNKNEQAESFVKRMAIEKGRKVHQTCLILAQDAIILAGDTIVFFKGQILGKPETLIQNVSDRPGHDARYALDSSKLRDLGWSPSCDYTEAMQRTVEWYVANEVWWRNIKESGDFRDYYQRNYGKR